MVDARDVETLKDGVMRRLSRPTEGQKKRGETCATFESAQHSTTSHTPLKSPAKFSKQFKMTPAHCNWLYNMYRIEIETIASFIFRTLTVAFSSHSAPLLFLSSFLDSQPTCSAKTEESIDSPHEGIIAGDTLTGSNGFGLRLGLGFGLRGGSWSWAGSWNWSGSWSWCGSWSWSWSWVGFCFLIFCWYGDHHRSIRQTASVFTIFQINVTAVSPHNMETTGEKSKTKEDKKKK